MKLVYIAGPYTAKTFLGIDQNIADARIAAANLASAGIGFLCPHLNSAHFEVITPEVPPEFWYEMTMEMLRRADGVWALPGWSFSKGTKAEIAEASKLGLPLFYTQDAVIEWAHVALEATS